jgi:hypothetical protein
MGELWFVAAAWVLLAIGVALLIGRSVALADRKETVASAGGGKARKDVRRPDLVDTAPRNLVAVPPAKTESAPAGRPVADEPAPAPGPAGRDTPTIPGLPSARPPVGRPPVPRSTRQRPHRRSGSG